MLLLFYPFAMVKITMKYERMDIFMESYDFLSHFFGIPEIIGNVFSYDMLPEIILLTK